jgi:hypothetical protein
MMNALHVSELLYVHCSTGSLLVMTKNTHMTRNYILTAFTKLKLDLELLKLELLISKNCN